MGAFYSCSHSFLSQSHVRRKKLTETGQVVFFALQGWLYKPFYGVVSQRVFCPSPTFLRTVGAYSSVTPIIDPAPGLTPGPYQSILDQGESVYVSVTNVLAYCRKVFIVKAPQFSCLPVPSPLNTNHRFILKKAVNDVSGWNNKIRTHCCKSFYERNLQIALLN